MGSDTLTSTKPIPIPTQEEDSLNQSTALLTFNTDSSESSSNPSHRPTTTIVFIALMLITCIALSAVAAFGFLFFSATSSSSSSSSSETTACSLKKLDKPVVFLISADGFRFGYQFKTSTPNIHRLINNGTEAETSLISVFPTLTFPNHYAIVTGLYPTFFAFPSALKETGDGVAFLTCSGFKELGLGRSGAAVLK